MVEYRGFSSQYVDQGYDTRLVDNELIKADLLNHFSIRKGEVRGRPRFGSNVKNFIGQQFDDFTKVMLENDVKSVMSADPRIKVNDLTITSTIDSMSFIANITYLHNKANELLTILINNTGTVTIQ